ncbi:hypothetical protein ACFOD0_09405 [Shewanella intestini]|uniref:DUF4252 domain-containing protein n=1 Tax=Shewanella intestini TaxID=2017544 RepID=A0ABS5I2P5_9GAMM|nr:MULTISPECIES: hypothetical protein [Shewanella]MBR9728103.1 hypothetical protein [Shewanella intestini]MRG36574.1 hypothetical protein [Shewanella sp. XMDDZSB0408]
MKKCLLVICMLGLTACATTNNESITDSQTQVVPTAIDMTGMDNEQAANQLYLSLLKANYLVEKVGSNRVAIQFGEQQFVLQANMNDKGIDRILANRYFAVHPQLHGSKDLLLTIGQLNQKLNFAKFLIRENGAIIQVQSAATFVQKIDLEELRRFMLWTDEGLRQVGRSFPKNTEELIKPLPLMQHPQGI